METQRKLSFVATSTFVLAAVLTAVPGATAQTPGRIGFGVDVGGYDSLTAAGLRPEYVQLWVGPWNLKSGWSNIDAQLDKSRGDGSIPVIQFYYWGSDLSATCLDQGCWSSIHNAWKDQGSWSTLASQLVQHLAAKLSGKSAAIVLETEFNKNGMSRSETLDAALATKAWYFRNNFAGSKIVLGFGNWGYPDWGTFDRAAGASHYVGLQGMRASTRDSESSYLGLPQALVDGANELKRRFANITHWMKSHMIREHVT